MWRQIKKTEFELNTSIKTDFLSLSIFYRNIMVTYESVFKQIFTSRSLSPTLTPALAAGPSSDTLEMKIP